MDEEIKQYKKYIYVSNMEQAIIETVARENHITMSNRYIKEVNFSDLLREELKNLNGINFFILDVNALTRLTPDKEFITQVRLIREMYPGLRIIMLAQGCKQGNLLLRQTI